MLRRKTKPEAPPNQDAESPPEPQTAPKPDATPKEEPWWAVTTPRNEARLFFAVYFAWQSATLLAKMRDMRVFLDMGYLPKGGRFCWHAPVALTPATHGYAVLLLAAALLALAAAVARAAPAPATRCLALGAYAAARVAFPPVERMASIEKKANMVYVTLLLAAAAPEDALTGAWGAPTAAWPLTVYRVVIYVAYFNAGVSKLVAASPTPSSAEFAATSHGAARWLPGLSALVLRGARRVSLDFSDGGTLRGAVASHLALRPPLEGVARQLVDAPAACALLSFGSLAFELLGWTLALRPREAHRLLAAGVGAVGFHLGIFLLMRINYLLFWGPSLLSFFTPFLATAALGRRRRHRRRGARARWIPWVSEYEMFASRKAHDLALGPAVRARVAWAPRGGDLRPWSPSGGGLHVLKQSRDVLTQLAGCESRGAAKLARAVELDVGESISRLEVYQVVAALAAAPDAPDAGAGDDGDDAPSAASFNAAREARRGGTTSARRPAVATVADDRILQLDRNGTNRWTLRFAGCGATSIPVATWRTAGVQRGEPPPDRRRGRRRGARGLPGRAPREARGRRRPHRRGQGLAPGGVERTQAVDGPPADAVRVASAVVSTGVFATKDPLAATLGRTVQSYTLNVACKEELKGPCGKAKSRARVGAAGAGIAGVLGRDPAGPRRRAAQARARGGRGPRRAAGGATGAAGGATAAAARRGPRAAATARRETAVRGPRAAATATTARTA
ncbi:hypothetical protein JL722_6137 [Aureococcus anophagefferens]|nr:hypothetical protein JL722_6137 [Aureococcus anophagefferens]